MCMIAFSMSNIYRSLLLSIYLYLTYVSASLSLYLRSISSLKRHHMLRMYSREQIE